MLGCPLVVTVSTSTRFRRAAERARRRTSPSGTGPFCVQSRRRTPMSKTKDRRPKATLPTRSQYPKTPAASLPCNTPPFDGVDSRRSTKPQITNYKGLSTCTPRPKKSAQLTYVACCVLHDRPLNVFRTLRVRIPETLDNPRPKAHHATRHKNNNRGRICPGRRLPMRKSEI
jgi:hypothetical protein